MLADQMHARGCAGVDCTGQAKRRESRNFFFHTFVTLPGVVRKERARWASKALRKAQRRLYRLDFEVQ